MNGDTILKFYCIHIPRNCACSQTVEGQPWICSEDRILCWPSGSLVFL